MKAIACYPVVLLLLLFSVSSDAQNVKGKTKTVRITASMHCQSCADNITEKLNFEPGVKKVHADLKSKIVEIEYNPRKTDPEKLVQVIKNLGYDATLLVE